MAGLTSALGIQSKGQNLTAGQTSGVPYWGDLNLKLIGATGFRSPPSEWDVVRFGPSLQPLPGLAKVKRCERRMKLHRKEHPSSDFETQTFQGWSVVEFDFDLILFTNQQLQDFQSLLPAIFPGAGDPPSRQSSITVTTVTSSENIVNPNQYTAQGNVGTQQIQTVANTPKRPPIPIRMSHPALQVHGVDSVVVQFMNGPMQRSESVPDIFIVNFKTVQFKPSKPTTKKTLVQVQTDEDTTPTPVPAALDPTAGPSGSHGADPQDNSRYINFLSNGPGFSGNIGDFSGGSGGTLP